MGTKPGFRITTIHAFICVGEDDEEGIVARMAPNGMWMPLVAADENRLKVHDMMVAELVEAGLIPNCKLVRFSVREDIKEY